MDNVTFSDVAVGVQRADIIVEINGVDVVHFTGRPRTFTYQFANFKKVTGSKATELLEQTPVDWIADITVRRKPKPPVPNRPAGSVIHKTDDDHAKHDIPSKPETPAPVTVVAPGTAPKPAPAASITKKPSVPARPMSMALSPKGSSADVDVVHAPKGADAKPNKAEPAVDESAKQRPSGEEATSAPRHMPAARMKALANPAGNHGPSLGDVMNAAMNKGNSDSEPKAAPRTHKTAEHHNDDDVVPHDATSDEERPPPVKLPGMMDAPSDDGVVLRRQPKNVGSVRSGPVPLPRKAAN